MKTIKPNENNEVVMYGHTIRIDDNAKEAHLFGVDYKVDWGKKSKKSKKTDVTEVTEAVENTEVDVDTVENQE